MAKAATKTRKKPAKQTATKKAPAKPKAKKPKAKKPKSNLLGGVAKGIAWLGDKVRGVVSGGKKPKKKTKAKKPKAAKRPAKAKAGAPAAPLVTLNNPLP